MISNSNVSLNSHQKKYLCSAPKPEVWDEYSDAVLQGILFQAVIELSELSSKSSPFLPSSKLSPNSNQHGTTNNNQVSTKKKNRNKKRFSTKKKSSRRSNNTNKNNTSCILPITTDTLSHAIQKVESTIVKCRTWNPIRERTGPGRKSNAEHAIQFYEHLRSILQQRLLQRQQNNSSNRNNYEDVIHVSLSDDCYHINPQQSPQNSESDDSKNPLHQQDQIEKTNSRANNTNIIMNNNNNNCSHNNHKNGEDVNQFRNSNTKKPTENLDDPRNYTTCESKMNRCYVCRLGVTGDNLEYFDNQSPSPKPIATPTVFARHEQEDEIKHLHQSLQLQGQLEQQGPQQQQQQQNQQKEQPTNQQQQQQQTNQNVQFQKLHQPLLSCSGCTSLFHLQCIRPLLSEQHLQQLEGELQSTSVETSDGACSIQRNSSVTSITWKCAHCLSRQDSTQSLTQFFFTKEEQPFSQRRDQFGGTVVNAEGINTSSKISVFNRNLHNYKVLTAVDSNAQSHPQDEDAAEINGRHQPPVYQYNEDHHESTVGTDLTTNVVACYSGESGEKYSSYNDDDDCEKKMQLDDHNTIHNTSIDDIDDINDETRSNVQQLCFTNPIVLDTGQDCKNASSFSMSTSNNPPKQYTLPRIPINECSQQKLSSERMMASIEPCITHIDKPMMVSSAFTGAEALSLPLSSTSTCCSDMRVPKGETFNNPSASSSVKTINFDIVSPTVHKTPYVTSTLGPNDVDSIISDKNIQISGMSIMFTNSESTVFQRMQTDDGIQINVRHKENKSASRRVLGTDDNIITKATMTNANGEPLMHQLSSESETEIYKASRSDLNVKNNHGSCNFDARVVAESESQCNKNVTHDDKDIRVSDIDKRHEVEISKSNSMVVGSTTTSELGSVSTISTKKRSLELTRLGIEMTETNQYLLNELAGGSGLHQPPLSKRVKKKPTLYDPQVCPASSWKSDFVVHDDVDSNNPNSSNESQHESKITTSTASSSSSVDTAGMMKKSVDSNNKTNNDISTSSTTQLGRALSEGKILRSQQEEQLQQNIAPSSSVNDASSAVWCTFCHDDPDIVVCCFCACRVCFGKHNQSMLLLCDMCDEEYHTFCLKPPLPSVPTSKQWFCPACVTKQKNSSTDSPGTVPLDAVDGTMKVTTTMVTIEISDVSPNVAVQDLDTLTVVEQQQQQRNYSQCSSSTNKNKSRSMSFSEQVKAIDTNTMTALSPFVEKRPTKQEQDRPLIYRDNITHTTATDVASQDDESIIKISSLQQPELKIQQQQEGKRPDIQSVQSNPTEAANSICSNKNTTTSKLIIDNIDNDVCNTYITNNSNIDNKIRCNSFKNKTSCNDNNTNNTHNNSNTNNINSNNCSNDSNNHNTNNDDNNNQSSSNDSNNNHGNSNVSSQNTNSNRNTNNNCSYNMNNITINGNNSDDDNNHENDNQNKKNCSNTNTNTKTKYNSKINKNNTNNISNSDNLSHDDNKKASENSISTLLDDQFPPRRKRGRPFKYPRPSLPDATNNTTSNSHDATYISPVLSSSKKLNPLTMSLPLSSTISSGGEVAMKQKVKRHQHSKVSRMGNEGPQAYQEHQLSVVSSSCFSFPVLISRSGRKVKRTNFHDEIDEGEQHLRSTLSQSSRYLSTTYSYQTNPSEVPSTNSIRTLMMNSNRGNESKSQLSLSSSVSSTPEIVRTKSNTKPPRNIILTTTVTTGNDMKKSFESSITSEPKRKRDPIDDSSTAETLFPIETAAKEATLSSLSSLSMSHPSIPSDESQHLHQQTIIVLSTVDDTNVYMKQSALKTIAQGKIRSSTSITQNEQLESVGDVNCTVVFDNNVCKVPKRPATDLEHTQQSSKLRHCNSSNKLNTIFDSKTLSEQNNDNSDMLQLDSHNDDLSELKAPSKNEHIQSPSNTPNEHSTKSPQISFTSALSVSSEQHQQYHQHHHHAQQHQGALEIKREFSETQLRKEEDTVSSHIEENSSTSLSTPFNNLNSIDLLASSPMVTDQQQFDDYSPNITNDPFHTCNSSINNKLPRRKPGARECMQISRRFGINIIPQQYMDILLDYCARGKVEHLIRMRERLDEHARFLESQLAGLESLVLVQKLKQQNNSTSNSVVQNSDESIVVPIASQMKGYSSSNIQHSKNNNYEESNSEHNRSSGNPECRDNG